MESEYKHGIYTMLADLAKRFTPNTLSGDGTNPSMLLTDKNGVLLKSADGYYFAVSER